MPAPYPGVVAGITAAPTVRFSMMMVHHLLLRRAQNIPQ